MDKLPFHLLKFASLDLGLCMAQQGQICAGLLIFLVKFSQNRPWLSESCHNIFVSVQVEKHWTKSCLTIVIILHRQCIKKNYWNNNIFEKQHVDQPSQGAHPSSKCQIFSRAIGFEVAGSMLLLHRKKIWCTACSSSGSTACCRASVVAHVQNAESC